MLVVKPLVYWPRLLCLVLACQTAFSVASTLGLDCTQPSEAISNTSHSVSPTEALLVNSGAALVAHGATDKLFFEKNIHTQLSIASITKLMMAMVILDAHLPMDERITILPEDIDVIKRSRSRLKIGTILSRREALLLAMMSSENRAAFALARTYPGGTPAFIESMNKKAKSLNMSQTVFCDPTGLDARNLSTAADLLTMVKAALRYPLLRDYSTQRTYELKTKEGVTLTYNNSNPIIRDHSWHIKLQKTGFTREAGRCMVAYATVNDQPYIFILLAARNSVARGQDAYLLKTSLEQGNGLLGLYRTKNDGNIR